MRCRLSQKGDLRSLSFHLGSSVLRLSCQAGQRETHLDKLTLEETAGMWEEGRSYIRYEKPMLGVWNDEVVIVTPGCQDIVTLIDEKGQENEGFNRFTMAAINPHTTQEKGRDCVDCHSSPKTVGLGEGTVVEREGRLEFHGVDRGVETSNGKTVPFDAYVTIDGEALQYSSRPEVRPFNGLELDKVLRVGLCVGCHKSYDDPLWKNYKVGMKCPRETEGASMKRVAPIAHDG